MYTYKMRQKTAGETVHRRKYNHYYHTTATVSATLTQSQNIANKEINENMQKTLCKHVKQEHKKYKPQT